MRGSLGIERRHHQRDSIHDININLSNAPSRSKHASTDQTTANSLVRPRSSASARRALRWSPLDASGSHAESDISPYSRESISPEQHETNSGPGSGRVGRSTGRAQGLGSYNISLFRPPAAKPDVQAVSVLLLMPLPQSARLPALLAVQTPISIMWWSRGPESTSTVTGARLSPPPHFGAAN
jgi:hypothetical protein